MALRRGLLWLGMVFGILDGVSNSLCADDRLRYLDSTGQEIRERTGTVVDQSDGKLLFDVPGETGGRLTIPVDRILELEFEGTPEWIAAVASYRAGKWEEAFGELVQAYRAETRDWAKLEIQALLIRCAVATGRNELACRGFQELVDADPETRHLGIVPLAWVRGEVDAAWAGVAKGWLGAPSPWDQLLGASWMLNTTSKEEARGVLLDLTDSRDRRIRFLAQMQLRRDEVGSVDLAKLVQWEQEIDAAPVAFRGGPRWMIAVARARLTPGDEAALTYLQFGLHEAVHEAWQAEGLLGAIRQLASAQPAEAVRLFTELDRRFPQSDAAKLARQMSLGTQR